MPERGPRAERRLDARILPGEPLEVVASGGGQVIPGRLVDASPGGIAFLCEAAVLAGRELSVRIGAVAAAPLLPATKVRIVRSQRVGADVLVHAAFLARPPLGWLDELQAARVQA